MNPKIAIINATQHKSTMSQREAGVVDLKGDDHSDLCALLTFTEIPSYPEMKTRAYKIVRLLSQAFGCGPVDVMIGGAPFFMSILENVLILEDYNPIYSFSERISVEIQLEDGSVKKENVFKHTGFVSSRRGGL